MPLQPLTTQIVGSYRKPHWLANHQRMRALDDSWWRPDPEVLDEAKRDAALLAIYDQERAGLALVTDGEAQRAAYDRHFLAGLTGIDTEHLSQAGHSDSEVTTVTRRTEGYEEHDRLTTLRPQITDDITFRASVSVEEVRFLKRHASRPIKATVIGPMSLFFQTVDRFYGDDEAAVLAFAAALNQELAALEAAGADVLQIDEPVFHSRLSLTRRVGKRAIDRMATGIAVPVIVHLCYGYAFVIHDKSPSPTYPEALEILSDCAIAGISLEYEQPGHEPSILRHCGDKHVVLGLLDLGKREAETPDHIAGRLRAALEVVPPERLHPASDCGMWYLPRDLAYAKIRALAEGTAMVR